jgi:hypothetical protein
MAAECCVKARNVTEEVFKNVPATMAVAQAQVIPAAACCRCWQQRLSPAVKKAFILMILIFFLKTRFQQGMSSSITYWTANDFYR